MSHDDFAVEPIPGLPQRPPQGELVLWQGSPDWRTFAINAFHARKIAIYLAILVGWQVAVSIDDGRPLAETLSRGVFFLALAAIPVLLIALWARLYSKSCIYTITSRRIVFRHGVAMPITVNIPFALVDRADLQPLSNGRGNIAIGLTGRERASLVALWPSIRPWRWRKPEPALRCIPNAEAVARLLGRAIAATAEGEIKSSNVRTLKPSALGPMAGAATA